MEGSAREFRRTRPQGRKYFTSAASHFAHAEPAYSSPPCCREPHAHDEGTTIEGLIYGQLFDYWIQHRQITIHMGDKEGHATAFATSLPHPATYIDELRRAIDRAECFQIGCGQTDGARGLS